MEGAQFGASRRQKVPDDAESGAHGSVVAQEAGVAKSKESQQFQHDMGMTNDAQVSPATGVSQLALDGNSDHFAASERLWDSFMSEETRGLVSKKFGGRTASLMRSAKRRHRTDMRCADWSKYGYHTRWEGVRQQMVEMNLDNVERIHEANFTPEEFREKFERPLKPCVIQGLADEWPARTDWGSRRLRQAFGERVFKCGEDDDGYSIKVKLKHFIRYLNSDEEDGAMLDDSPLYIFDSHFDEDPVSKQLLREYFVPSFFNEDLFQYVGEKRRPPYRWILVGPARSGSSVHIDPLGTSAWNTLIRGHKLWTLFPPHIPRLTVKGKQYVNWKVEDDEPVDWNFHILPRILANHPELKPLVIQFIQKPGETVFVPSNWWHGVLNLDTTVAVTQNFCSTGNFEEVWRQTRTGRRKMAKAWRRSLSVVRPDLSQIAFEIDKNDNFDLDSEIERSEERKRQKKLAKREKKRKTSDSSSE